MKTIVINAKTVSGTVGLTICYLVSLYFFWNSQVSFSDFFIDPQNSRFTRFLRGIFVSLRWGDSYKTLGVVMAFLSIHLSWALRYRMGYLIEALLNRYVYRKDAPEAWMRERNTPNTSDTQIVGLNSEIIHDEPSQRINQLTPVQENNEPLRSLPDYGEKDKN